MLRDVLLNIADSYPAYRALKKTNKEAPVCRAVTDTVPEMLRGFLPDTTHIRFHGSTGLGSVTASPWIATFDDRVTTSAARGFYPVYLFSIDFKRLFLALAFGTTQFTDFYGENAKALKKIQNAAKRFYTIQKEAFPSNWHVGPIDLAATSSHKRHRGYEHCTIASVSYQINGLPSHDELAEDYRKMVSVYRALVESPISPSVADLLEESAEPPKVDDLTPSVTPFVPRPKPKKSGEGCAGGNRRRSKQSQKVGKAGEQAVFAYEKKKLIEAGQKKLASEVVWEDEKGNYPGWDISSFDESGSPICIEVKSTIENAITNVELTANEWSAALERGKRYKIYVVTQALKSSPKIEVLEDPSAYVKQGQLKIEPSVFKLSFYDNADSAS